MSEINWKWTDEGVEISNGSGAPLKFKRMTSRLGEVMQFITRLSEAREIFITLREAQGAYRAGLANYSNAVENLRMLLAEQDKASEEVTQASKDVEVFFEPPGLSKAFGEDVKSLIAFGQDAAKNLKPK